MASIVCLSSWNNQITRFSSFSQWNIFQIYVFFFLTIGWIMNAFFPKQFPLTLYTTIPIYRLLWLLSIFMIIVLILYTTISVSARNLDVSNSRNGKIFSFFNIVIKSIYHSIVWHSKTTSSRQLMTMMLLLFSIIEEIVVYEWLFLTEALQ